MTEPVSTITTAPSTREGWKRSKSKKGCVSGSKSRKRGLEERKRLPSLKSNKTQPHLLKLKAPRSRSPLSHKLVKPLQALSSLRRNERLRLVTTLTSLRSQSLPELGSLRGKRLARRRKKRRMLKLPRWPRKRWNDNKRLTTKGNLQAEQTNRKYRCLTHRCLIQGIQNQESRIRMLRGSSSRINSLAEHLRLPRTQNRNPDVSLTNRGTTRTALTSMGSIAMAMTWMASTVRVSTEMATTTEG